MNLASILTESCTAQPVACFNSLVVNIKHVMLHAAESCIIDKEDAKHHLTPTQRVRWRCPNLSSLLMPVIIVT